MQALKNTELFTEISAEESAVVSGGDSAQIGGSLSQIIFALGASVFTGLLTRDEGLARSVLTTQFNRAFGSLFSFGFLP